MSKMRVRKSKPLTTHTPHDVTSDVSPRRIVVQQHQQQQHFPFRSLVVSVINQHFSHHTLSQMIFIIMASMQWNAVTLYMKLSLSAKNNSTSHRIIINLKIHSVQPAQTAMLMVIPRGPQFTHTHARILCVPCASAALCFFFLLRPSSLFSFRRQERYV